jgi:hypothetical protein
VSFLKKSMKCEYSMLSLMICAISVANEIVDMKEVAPFYICI